MRKIILAVCLALSLHAQTPVPSSRPSHATARTQPKLVVAIVIDQFRYDYLTRFRDDYTGGLKRLLDQGAVFTNAHYIHVPTVTAVGHSTFLSGATPAMSGIIGNEWWDRETHKARHQRFRRGHQAAGRDRRRVVSAAPAAIDAGR